MFGFARNIVTDEPNLHERAFAAGCTRLAVISLHPGAGARTVLERSATEFHQRGIAVGVTRAPRLPLERLTPGGGVPIRLPGGTIVATTRDGDVADEAGLRNGRFCCIGFLSFCGLTITDQCVAYLQIRRRNGGRALRCFDDLR